MRFASKSGRLLVLLTLLGFLGAGCRNRNSTKEPTTVVRGRVTSVSAGGIGKARAILEREGSPGVERRAVVVEVASDGVFSMEGVTPGRYVLRAEAPGHASAVVALQVAAGEEVKASLRLVPAHPLAGTVTDGRGKPLPDALLLAWPFGGPRRTLVETRSDAAGRFTLPGLAVGRYTVLAEVPGVGSVQVDKASVPGPPIALRLEGESRSIGGIVVDGSGAGVPGARVLLGSPNLRVPRELTADASGAFLFHGVGHGKYTLRATAGALSSLPVGQLIEEGLGWIPPFRLTLTDSSRVKGRVVDDRGQPVGGARVEVLAIPADDLPVGGSTDAHGRFEVAPLPPGRYQLIARAPDHAAAELGDLRLRSDGNRDVELRAPRGARVVGRVLDDAGHPVSGATITATGLAAAGDELTVLSGSLPLAAEAAQLPPKALVRQTKLRAGSSDEEGAFEVDGISPGPTRIEIVHPDKLPVRRDHVVLAAGARHALGDVLLTSGVLVGGRVLDDTGGPIGAARIEARAATKRGAVPSAPPVRGVSEPDGAFTLRLPPGEYAITAQAAERLPQSVFAFQAEKGRPVPPLEFRLPRAAGQIEGQVRDAGGRPAGRAAVRAYPVPSPAAALAPGREEAPPLAAAETDAAGRFRLTGLPQGEVLLQATHPEWPQSSAVAAVGTRAIITFARPGGVDGEVRDRETGAFVTGYRLIARGPDGTVAARVRTIGAGFQILGLVPGRWLLRLSAPGYQPLEHAVEVSAGTSAKEPSVRGVRVELSRAADDAGAGAQP